MKREYNKKLTNAELRIMGLTPEELRVLKKLAEREERDLLCNVWGGSA